MKEYDFKAPFQQKIAAYILRHSEIISRVKGVVQPEYFSDPDLRKIITMAVEFHRTYKNTPSKDEFLAFATRVDPKINIGLIKRLYKNKLKNPEFVFDQAIEFAQFAAVKEAILTGADMLGEKEDRAQIKSLISDALKVGADTRDLGIDLLGGRHERYRHRLKYGFDEDRISTGLSRLDSHLEGGLGRGELGLVMAPPKGFKTGTLVNFAHAVAASRLNAVIYTFEVDQDKYTLRVERRMAGLNKQGVIDNFDKLDKSLRIIEKLGGGLYVKGYPMRRASMDDINAHLDMLAGYGFVPDVVFIDYWDLVKPLEYDGEVRHKLASIGYDMRALAQERNIAVWTATQVNRKAVSKKVIRKEDVAEAFEKMAIVDLAIANCQTPQERELKPSRMRFFIAAAREVSESGIVYTEVDYEKMRIRQKNVVEEDEA